MAAAASSAGLLVSPSAGLGGGQKTMAAGEVRNYTCSTRLCFPLAGAALQSHLTGRNLQYSHGSLFGNTFLTQHQNGHAQVAHGQSSSRATVTQEPQTGVDFSGTLTGPGASTELSFVGAGVREKKVAFVKVKICAVGVYIDASTLADSSVGAWKGKSGSELTKDEGFFKALIEVPVEKALKIVLVRDVEGSQFWGALGESLTPRLKTAGTAGQQALASFGNVFKTRPLKKGTSILLTWSLPATLLVSIVSKEGSSAASAPDASIESAALLAALFDVYLGKDTVSPSTKSAVASGFPSLI